jgi:uncharacterized protein YbjT (DUF2867 family)
MLAAAAGRPYAISYGGKSGLNYVDDVARLFIAASRAEVEGAEVLNVRGSVVDMPEIIETIFKVLPEARGLITHASTLLPLPGGMVDGKLRRLFPDYRETALIDGVSQTIATFRQALQSGKLHAGQIPG